MDMEGRTAAGRTHPNCLVTFYRDQEQSMIIKWLFVHNATTDGPDSEDMDLELG